jgi:uncharacterized protein YndB with AHSA1/START domain
MKTDLIAKTSLTINAPRVKVWDALVNTEAIKKYMFGTNVVTDWKEGSSIIWKGEWQGKPYEDKGVILKLEPLHTLKYSHFSPLSGLTDRPENYHTVTVELPDDELHTYVLISQDNNPTEQDRKHSEENWGLMLAAMKKFLEE